MITSEIHTAAQLWPSFAPLMFVPHNEHEYERLVQVLDALIDVVGEEEAHSLASLMEIVGVLVERYEDAHVPELSS